MGFALRTEKFILDNRDYFYSFALPIIFPPYVAYTISQELLSHAGVVDQHSTSREKSASATGLAFGYAYNTFSVSRGLSTIGQARFAALTLAKQGFSFPSVPLLPPSLVKAGKFGGAAAVLVQAELLLLEGFVDVYTSPVTGKPTWFPLPFWVMFMS